MTQKKMFVLSAIIFSFGVLVFCWQVAGQYCHQTALHATSQTLLADGDPMPPFPEPPAMPLDADTKFQGVQFVTDGDPMPPFPEPPGKSHDDPDSVGA